MRKKLRGALIAPPAALDAVEAAIALPFDEGIRREGQIFERCLHSDQCKGLYSCVLRRTRRGENNTRHSQADTLVYPIRQAVVIGAGTMGGGIAMALANT